MKIGIFDSGLGGLLIAHALTTKLSSYDYLYLGDSANLPYGQKTKEQIYELSQKAINRLFEDGCKLVVVACNSASSDALRRIQQEFIPAYWPGRNALGVLIPSAEEAVRYGKNIGIISTNATASSGAFEREIIKLRADANVYSCPTPELAECIEKGQLASARRHLEKHLGGLMRRPLDSLVLGCTHYPVLKKHARQIVGAAVPVISQDEIIPDKLRDYLRRHPEIEAELGKNGSIEFLLTKKSAQSGKFAERLFGQTIQLKLVGL